MGHVDTVIDGEKWPSVTQIVGVLDKPFLYRWYGTLGWDECERIKKESQDRGTSFHENIEFWLRVKYGIVPGLNSPQRSDEIGKAVRAVECWTDVVGFVPLDFEKYVISKKHKFGGTFDCLGKINDELVIVDWKFTNQIAETYVLQLAGYAQACYEETGQQINSGRVVRPYELKRPAKETGFKQTAEGWKYSFKNQTFYIEERQYNNLNHYLKPFLNCREIYDFINKKGMWEQ